jgi:23S rRNA (adenine2503-C2)-methyltransferase
MMTLNIVGTHGEGDLAKVYVASLGHDGSGRDRMVEFVESIQPPHPREEKWVLIVSSLLGCPVDCPMCDAGGHFQGRLGVMDILAQVDAMVLARYPDGKVPAGKFKVQFARMGDPAFNPAVLGALRRLPDRYDAPGLIPCISTIAPAGTQDFFDELLKLKDELYSGGRFQLQFSVHSTDPAARRRLIPIRKWRLRDIAAYGRKWYKEGDRKITLNFAAMEGYPVDPERISKVFDPDRFLIKLTPLNPTTKAGYNGLTSLIDGYNPATADQLIDAFEKEGFQVILSIGEMEENHIGSNCGQYVRAMSCAADTIKPR